MSAMGRVQVTTGRRRAQCWRVWEGLCGRVLRVDGLKGRGAALVEKGGTSNRNLMACVWGSSLFGVCVWDRVGRSAETCPGDLCALWRQM